MLFPRVIPVLLYSKGLVKSERFKNHRYVGDPINAVKIFNEKEVDEIVLLDIDASKNKTSPNFKLIEEIGTEAFMPFSYGGGITTIEQIQTLISLGAEKIILNTSAINNPRLITEAADYFGSSSVIVSIDVKKNLFGKYQIYSHVKGKTVDGDPLSMAVESERLGAGEILINSVDLDGTMQGYDLRLIKSVAEKVNVPVIACGGAGNIGHMETALRQGQASAVAAGSMFVFHGKHRAVLISYPDRKEINKLI